MTRDATYKHPETQGNIRDLIRPKTKEVKIDPGTQDNLNYLLRREVKGGNLNIVKHLVNIGADVNTKNTQGQSALILALESDSTSIATFLVSKGANFKAQDNSGNNLLMLLIQQNALFMFIKELVEQKVFDINESNRDKETALMMAMKGSKELIAFLLDNGADMFAISTLGNTAFSLAYHREDKEEILELMSNHVQAKRGGT